MKLIVASFYYIDLLLVHLCWSDCKLYYCIVIQLMHYIIKLLENTLEGKRQSTTGSVTLQQHLEKKGKRKGVKQFNPLKTTYLNDVTQKRSAGGVLEIFETNQQMIEHALVENENDFPLQIPINSQNDCVYFTDQKKDVRDKNLSDQTNRQSVKVMVSTALTWFGVTKPLIVNKKGLKITVNVLKKNYFLPLIRSINEKIGFSFKIVQRLIPVISFKIF